MRYVRSLRALLLFVLMAALMALAGQAWEADPDPTKPGVVGTYSRLVSGTASGLVPMGMYFAESDAPMAKELTWTLIEGGRQKDLWVMVEDSDGDGQIDPGDYQEISIIVQEVVSADVLVGVGRLASTDVAPPYLSLTSGDQAIVDGELDRAEEEWRRMLNGRFSYSGLMMEMDTDTDTLDWTWTGKPWLPNFDPAGGIQPVVGKIRIAGLQQGGDDEAAYEEQQTHLSFTLAWGASSVTEETRYEWPSAMIDITVRPRDMGGPDGDDSGGSCALGLGGAALSLALLALWRRRA